MRQVWIAMIFLAVTFCAVSQENTPKTEVSHDSLTSEQNAVYRAVLRDYPKTHSYEFVPLFSQFNPGHTVFATQCPPLRGFQCDRDFSTTMDFGF